MSDAPLWPGGVLGVLLALVTLAAVLVPALIVATTPRAVSVRARLAHPQRVVPRDVIPDVEPVKLAAVSARDAVAFNATIPFSTDPNPAARPFTFGGSAIDRERAVTCLAAAVLYEAGDDHVGQQAVAQVILNRVRHPAFPTSVCGVVFQGSERRTGCQFTFTCDGALARRYSDALWARARAVAAAAIDGAVDATVGHATHYHTDWVVPYWSSSLDKIVAVHTHLFFRWTGWWGTPPAFSNRRVTGVEPIIAQLAAYSPAHGGSEQAQQDSLGTLTADALNASALPRPIAVDADTYVIALDPRMAPTEYEALARRVCADKAYCKFLGWDDPKEVPQVSLSNLPADSPALQTMAFSFLRDRSRQFEKALWNCTTHPRDNAQQCMRQRVVAPVDPLAVGGAVRKAGGGAAKVPPAAATRPPEPLPLLVPRAVPTPAPAPAATPAAAPVR